jgi:hypothetical protein
MKPLATLLLLSALATSAEATIAPSRLPIINDDYARAQAEATQRNVPIFVEVWAPW